MCVPSRPGQDRDYSAWRSAFDSEEVKSEAKSMTIANNKKCAMCGGTRDCPSMQQPHGYRPAYACIREAGHQGKHVACTGFTHQVAEWGNSEEWPDSFWIADFMKFSKEGRPIEGTSWQWSGVVFNAKSALETALDAMIDEKPEEASAWRCVRVRMDLQAVVAQKAD
jgi:hypothetical protein